MSIFSKLAHRFRYDEGGYFAALFGIMLISITATSGAVVDFVAVQNARTNVQNALDITALSLQPLILEKNETQLKNMAQDLIDDIVDAYGLEVEIEDAEEVEADGVLFLQAKVDIPLHFVALVGVDSITARIASQVTKKALKQEIIMVLDNSGSMSNYSRLSNLKTAAVNATNILMGTGATSADTKMGIVPFTSYVNIGTSHSASAWMDVAGQSDIANDNFDNDDDDSTPYTGNVNRISLYAQLKGTSWGGCVEARAHTSTGTGSHLDTDDTTPHHSQKNTLFLPLFMPDERSGSSNYYNSYISDDNVSCSGNVDWLSSRERQERLCKYSGNVTVSGGSPNDDCPALPVLPLTDTKQNVIDEINAMTASGGTNIHMGTIWGFRALSPTLPFTEGGDYDPDLKKIMIIMTDGENTHPASSNINGSLWHSAYSYPSNGRLGAVGWSTSQLQGEMDNHTLESCANAKAAGIEIYTIGLNSPTTATTNMLTSCASGSDHAYFPSAASELDAVFTEIANNILAARITQ